jgi:ribosome-associated translation inhibitor RaiA
MMVVQTAFRHMEATAETEKMINEQIRAMKRHNLGFTRVAITVDALNETSIRCHILLRGKNKLSADTQVTHKDVISAVTMAFDSLEREVQRKLSRKYHKQLKTPYAPIDEYMSDFEDMYDMLPQRQPVLSPEHLRRNTVGRLNSKKQEVYR